MVFTDYMHEIHCHNLELKTNMLLCNSRSHYVNYKKILRRTLSSQFMALLHCRLDIPDRIKRAVPYKTLF